MTQLFLLNHAESLVKPEIPNKDWSLSEEGALQAINLSSFLANLDCTYIYSSPYLRCRETVTPYAKTSSKLINIHQGLKEIHASYQPVDHYNVALKKSWQDFDYSLPTGESCQNGQKRAITTLIDIANNHNGKKILISTHKNFIGLTLNSFIPDFGFENMQKIKEPYVVPIVVENNELSLGNMDLLGEDYELASSAFSPHLVESFTMFND